VLLQESTAVSRGVHRRAPEPRRSEKAPRSATWAPSPFATGYRPPRWPERWRRAFGGADLPCRRFGGAASRWWSTVAASLRLGRPSAPGGRVPFGVTRPPVRRCFGEWFAGMGVLSRSRGGSCDRELLPIAWPCRALGTDGGRCGPGRPVGGPTGRSRSWAGSTLGRAAHHRNMSANLRPAPHPGKGISVRSAPAGGANPLGRPLRRGARQDCSSAPADVCGTS
jgi:hypothetical protein